MRRSAWLNVCLGLIYATVLYAEEPDAWRPPFGLKRIGSSSSQTGFEADAEARPDQTINPVDLGAIFVPSGSLLLGPGQNAVVDVAALSHAATIENASVQAWFEANTQARSEIRTNLVRD